MVLDGMTVIDIRALNILSSSSFSSAIPKCSGTATVGLTEGEPTTLGCEAKYSGNSVPQLEWYRGDEALAGEDDNEIRLVRSSMTIRATYLDDGRTFTCRMKFERIDDSCGVTLDVKCEDRL